MTRATLEEYSEASAGGQFISAEDLPKGQMVQKVVREVTDHTFSDGKEKVGLAFEDETTLILNKTNAAFLADAGFTWEGVVGATITLSRQMDSYQGKPVAATRIVGAKAG